MNERIICPYCNYEFDASLEYLGKDFNSDGDEKIVQCEECEKGFRVILDVSLSYFFITMKVNNG